MRSISDDEKWMRITGYGNYQVSNLGRVRTWRILGQTESNGYRYVGLSKDSVQKRITVHSIVAEAFHGPRPEGMDCCHINGDRGDNRSGNLEWNTRSKNINDRYRHRRERDEMIRAKIFEMLDDADPAMAECAEELIELLRLT